VASFEEQLAELETVVEKLERGDLSLEENVALFERGVNLSDACKTQLESAESRIQVLLNPRESGPIRTEELEIEEGYVHEDEPSDDGRL